MVNRDGCPPAVREPTDNTYGCHHDGIETEVTPAQFRGSDGLAGSVSGLDSHADVPPPPPPRASPAAATITTSLSTAAYRSAAPSSALIDGLVRRNAGHRRDVDDARAEIGGAHHGAGQGRDVDRRLG